MPTIWSSELQWPGDAISVYNDIVKLPAPTTPPWHAFFPNETDIIALRGSCCQALYPNGGNGHIDSTVEYDTVARDCSHRLAKLLGLQVIDSAEVGLNQLPMQMAAQLAVGDCFDGQYGETLLETQQWREGILKARTTPSRSMSVWERLPEPVRTAIVANDTLHTPHALYVHLLVYDLRQATYTSGQQAALVLDRVFRVEQTRWRQSQLIANYPWEGASQMELDALRAVAKVGTDATSRLCSARDCEVFSSLADVGTADGGSPREPVAVECNASSHLLRARTAELRVRLPRWFYPTLRQDEFVMRTSTVPRVLHLTQKLVPRPNPANIAEITGTSHQTLHTGGLSAWQTYDRLARASIDFQWRPQQHQLLDTQQTFLMRYGNDCFRVFLETFERHRIA